MAAVDREGSKGVSPTQAVRIGLAAIAAPSALAPLAYLTARDDTMAGAEPFATTLRHHLLEVLKTSYVAAAGAGVIILFILAWRRAPPRGRPIVLWAAGAFAVEFLISNDAGNPLGILVALAMGGAAGAIVGLAFWVLSGVPWADASDVPTGGDASTA